MFTVIVNLTVRPDRVEEFIDGIRMNARASVAEEEGCLRFDVHRVVEQPHQFVLYEIYADAEAFYTTHRATPHYAAWRDVAAHCVEARGHVNTYATPVFPEAMTEHAEVIRRSTGGDER